MKISKGNLIIYAAGLAISLLLVGLYFICPTSPWCIVSCSVGASGIGAVALAFFIEWSNEKTRAENKSIIRASKLNIIESKAIRMLEKTVVCYFKRRSVILNLSKPHECHKMTYSELWEEINKQQEYCDQMLFSQDAALLTKINSIDNSIRRYCQSLTDYISNKIPEIQMFEAVGYFNNSETNCIISAGIFSNDVARYEASLDVESLSGIFDVLVQIKEFEHFKSITFYYKNKRVDWTSKNRAISDKIISKDDIDSAIPSSERQ